MFNSEKIKLIEESIKNEGFDFKSTFSGSVNVNWKEKVSNLDSEIFSNELKEKILDKIESYVKKMKKNN